MSNKYIAKMTGYKGTNADMTCTPNGGPKFQFELGKWYEHEGEIALCGAGFHFCVHPSGPYAFYSSSDSRVFKIEAEQVLDVPPEAGADFKLVAKRIRLVEEITPGDRTDKATGNRNTGNWNTGNWNTGDRNIGDRNTGDQNTGDWNATDHCPGFFCAVEPNVLSFDVQTELTHTEFLEAFPQASILGVALMSDEKINFEDFKMIPGITEEKLQLLHQKHLNGRKKA